MKFTKLRVAGFKSFVEPADLLIEPGLTGVIGPNGCGKSNLLEAMRWVMGAASAKSLRGAGMEDVIFAGSDKRPARDKAEVTLWIDNGDGAAPAKFNGADTLQVSRRIQRGKGSAYAVNGDEARAKDVQLLFADANTGANSPALVRQGQISELINAKPENRRRILEEAAGVAGLRARRREAELRLQAAEANLDRLQEVIDQLAARHDSLQRQARQAKRYRLLSQEIRSLERLLWRRRWREAEAAAESARQELAGADATAIETAKAAALASRNAEAAGAFMAPLRKTEAEASAALARLSHEQDALEREETAAHREIERLTARRKELAAAARRERELAEEAEAALNRLSRSLERLAEERAGEPAALATAQGQAAQAESARSEAEARLDAAAASAAEAKAARASAEAERDRTAKRARALAAEVDQLRARVSALAAPTGPSIDTLESAAGAAETALETARARLAEAETRRQAAESEAQAARSAAQSAAGDAAALARESEGLKRFATPAGEGGLVDQIAAPKGWEHALAAALGEAIEASLDPAAPRAWRQTAARAAPLPEGVTALSDQVRAPSPLAAVLSAVGLVEEAALEPLAARLEPGQALVTAAGALRRWDGYAAEPGAPSAAALRLEARARLGELETAHAEAARTAAAAKARQSEAQAALAASRERVDSARRDLAKAESAAREAQARLAKAREVHAGLSAQRAGLNERLESALAALEAAEAEAKAAARRFEALQGDAGEAAALEAAREAAQAARRIAAQTQAHLETLKREADGRRRRADALEREKADWGKRRSAAMERLSTLGAESDAAAKAFAIAEARPGKLASAKETLEGAIANARAKAELARQAVIEAEGSQKDADTALRAAEREAGAAREARAGAAARLQGAEARLKEMADRLEVGLGETPASLRSQKDADEQASQSTEAAEKALDTARLARERLGAVNLRAEEEAGALQSERDGLEKERDELAAAVARLRRGVDALSKEGRERLMAAFEVVDGHFRTLFATLFSGGRAELALTESEDPLEAGLEIMACPPGKKLSTLSLLSGGEQALTAAALIFAVFLSNPAPLCVLDEVDAPLDDANVDRFCRMLNKMRQLTETRFLIITHNPVTMARMDRLYGVTMAEQGVSQLVSVDLARAEAMLEAA